MNQSFEKYMARGSASTLTGTHQLVFVFIDDDGADGWTPAGRVLVARHVDSSLGWLVTQAQKHGVELSFQHAFAPRMPGLAQKVVFSISEGDLAAGPHHATWQNWAVAGLVNQSGSVASLWNDFFEIHGLPGTGINGRFVLFGVRRYRPSIAFPFQDGEDPEFEKERGIIYDVGADASGQPGQRYLDSLIAHEILHLYGAIDLAAIGSPIDPDLLREVVSPIIGPNEVMDHPTQQPINEYFVSDLTAYLVGWRSELPSWLTRCP
jgi:hypothetical protein